MPFLLKNQVFGKYFFRFVIKYLSNIEYTFVKNSIQKTKAHRFRDNFPTKFCKRQGNKSKARITYLRKLTKSSLEVDAVFHEISKEKTKGYP